MELLKDTLLTLLIQLPPSYNLRTNYSSVFQMEIPDLSSCQVDISLIIFMK